MNNRSTPKLDFAIQTTFAVTGILAITIPMILGIANMPALRAQSIQKFEVASVRRVEIPPSPYGVRVFPVTGGVGTSSPDRITYRGTWSYNLITEGLWRPIRLDYRTRMAP